MQPRGKVNFGIASEIDMTSKQKPVFSVAYYEEIEAQGQAVKGPLQEKVQPLEAAGTAQSHHPQQLHSPRGE